MQQGIDAGWGNDTINGGAGRDTINGGFGNDTVSYSDAPANQPGLPTGVTVDLSTGRGDGSHARGDTYTSVENVVGSNYADTITGNSGSNSLRGQGGNDLIQGGAGADVLDGGGVSEILAYFSSSAGVTVNLFAGTASGGDAQGDTFVNFESVMGTAFSDSLTGANNDNALWGGGDNDFLFGLGGADKLFGGDGIDTMNGGSGNGQGGGDILFGGENADTFVFETNFAAEDQGVDVIMDFEDGVDHLRFDIDNGFGAPSGMSQLTIFELFGNTVANYENGSVTLIGISADQITSADFEFV